LTSYLICGKSQDLIYDVCNKYETNAAAQGMFPLQCATKITDKKGIFMPAFVPAATDVAETQLIADQPKVRPFWQLFNISLGFIGIQFAWAVQYSQVSPFLETLGSTAILTALIWCAGPITGTFTQPIIGSISDKTWTLLGSRRPFLLLGALLVAFALFALPNSPNLLVAAALLWLLDISINMCQGPIRWLVVDVVHKSQHAFTYSLMGFTLAIGALTAFYIGTVSEDRQFIFNIGALLMLATMGWTILTTPETRRPHHDAVTEKTTLATIARDTWNGMTQMPREAQLLCWANGLTWFGAQCMFVFFPLYVAHNLYGAMDPSHPLYAEAVQKASFAWLIYYVVCLLASPVAGKLCERISMKLVHTVGLLCMAAGLLSMFFLTEPDQAVIAMGVAGVGWATTLSIPFAWAARYSPEGKGGVHLGVFNTYIAVASFFASLIVGFVVAATGNDASAMVLAGGAVLVSIALLALVKEQHPLGT
jgi:maltose/moltooligosaccharide transporter